MRFKIPLTFNLYNILQVRIGMNFEINKNDK